MHFMIKTTKQKTEPMIEPSAGRPAATGEEWLGRNRSSKRRLWERLNPRSRKQIRMLAEALAFQQTHANLPEPTRLRLSAAVGELVMNRLKRLDKVAYVRFASVYLDFKDVKEFMNELKDLVKVKGA